MAEYIKHTCKDCIHFKICNDYVHLVGREDKIACPDFKSTEDVVPISEVERYKTMCQCYHKMFEKIQEEHCLEINNAQTELSMIILYEILNFLISDMQDKAKAFDKAQTQKDKDFLMGVMSYQSCIKSLITEQIKKYIGE